MDEEEIVKTQVVSSKRQETVDDTGAGVVQLAVDKNMFDTETLKGEEPKKPVADSTRNVVVVAVAAKKDDSNTEDAKNKYVPATAKNNNDDDISSEEIGSDDESESEDTSQNRYVVPARTSAITYAWEEKIDRSNYTGPRPPIPPRDCGCKVLFMSNLHSSITDCDVRDFFKDDGIVVSVKFGRAGNGHVTFETYDASRKALKRNGEMLLGYPIKLIYSEDRGIWDLITPNPKYKYLFMGNLNPSIKKSDVVDFFKADGTVKLVRLMTDGPESVGYGHVKFASFDEALKAVQRGGEKLRGRKVELVLASESSVWHEYTPSSRKPPRFGVRRGPGYGSTTRGDGPLRYR